MRRNAPGAPSLSLARWLKVFKNIFKKILNNIFKALNRDWHQSCFTCSNNCDNNLHDGGFTEFNSRLLCMVCYHRELSNKQNLDICQTCLKVINGKALRFRGDPYVSEKFQKNSEKIFKKFPKNSKKKLFSVTTPITSTVQIARVIWIIRRVMSVASYSACPVTIKWAFQFAPRVAAQSKGAA